MEKFLENMLTDMGVDLAWWQRKMDEQEAFEQRLMNAAAEYERTTGKPFIEFREDV